MQLKSFANSFSSLSWTWPHDGAWSAIRRYAGPCADALFGMAAVASSLYLLLSYIPITFIGFIQHPLFTWVPKLGRITQILYLPALVAVLFHVNSGAAKTRTTRLTKLCVITQAAIGLVALLLSLTDAKISGLYFVARPLLFGPDLSGHLSGVAGYIGALCCLVPLFWLSVIKIASAYSAIPEAPVCRVNLFSVLSASLAVSLFYSAGAWIRYDLPLRVLLGEAAFSFAIGAALLTAIWQAWLYSAKACSRLRHPGIYRFLFRVLVSSFVCYLVVRKVVLGAIGFNSNLADLYALLLSLAVVFYVATFILKIRSSDPETAGTSATTWWQAVGKKLLLVAGIALAYALGVASSRIDWNHLCASLSALVIIGLTVRIFVVRGGRALKTDLRPGFALASVPLLAGIVVMQAGAWTNTLTNSLSASLERYSAYDGSLSLAQKLLQPATHDGAYREFYDFLNTHANIQQPVPAPDIVLAEKLEPARGPRPHIFLFVIDAMRKDYLSTYNPKVTFTPAIQAFSDESIVFTNAMTPYGGSALAEPAIWTGVQEIHKHYPMPLARMNALSKMLEADHYRSYIAYDFITEPLVPRTPNVTGIRDTFHTWQEKEFGPVLAEIEEDLKQGKNPEQPVFAYSQPVNLHTLVVGQFHDLHGKPHPGFHADYVAALETVDREFGEFIQFLKDRRMYENSVVILTADHGESLGEWGRWGHISIAPEIINIPLIIHVPERYRSKLVWDASKPAFLHDIAPSLYYLLGHAPLKNGAMYGRPLFTNTLQEQPKSLPDHYLLRSSYLPVFGVLSGDLKNLFIVDAGAARSEFFDLENDPGASINKISPSLVRKYEHVIRDDLKRIDAFYHVSLGD
jgi:sulfatase-like protein